MESPPPGGTAPSATPPLQRKGGGVADYFAILGIGENLVLKSTQKKNQLVSVRNANNETEAGTAGGIDDTNKTTTASESEDEKKKRLQALIEEEEEFAMVERFYREIVEVAIFTVYSDKSGKDIEGTLATSSTEEGEYSYGCGDFDTVEHTEAQFFNSCHDSHSNHTENVHDTSRLRRNHVSRSTRVSIEQGANESGADSLPVEITGFKILYKTTPVGKASIGDMSRVSSNHDSDNSFMNEQDVSMNTTSDALFGESSGTMARNVEQSYDANMHPNGLRGNILSIVMNVENNVNGESVGGADAGCQPISRQEREQQGGLGNLVGRRVENLRHHLAPILSNPTVMPTNRYEDSNTSELSNTKPKRFYIGHRRRGADEIERPAISDLVIRYCRVHCATLIPHPPDERSLPTQDGSSGESGIKKPSPKLNYRGLNAETAQKGAMALRRGLVNGMGIATRAAASGTSRIIGNRMRDLSKEDHTHLDHKELSENESQESIHNFIVNLSEVLPLPDGFDEWVIPDMYQQLKIPLPNQSSDTNSNSRNSSDFVRPGGKKDETETEMGERRMRKTFLFNHQNNPISFEKGMGIEAFVDGNTFLLPSSSPSSLVGSPDRRNPWSPVDGPPIDSVPSSPTLSAKHSNDCMNYSTKSEKSAFMPTLIASDSLPDTHGTKKADDTFEYVPIIAVRRQRVGDEERYREDPGVVEVEMTFSNPYGNPAMPVEDEMEEEENNENEDTILGKTSWSVSKVAHVFSHDNVLQEEREAYAALGLPMVILRHNLPLGFADTPFATRVLDRFPKEDYKGVPLPQEELPMFCYPTGCRLFRQKYQDASSAECYGFVVKNEQGDSIHGEKKSNIAVNYIMTAPPSNATVLPLLIASFVRFLYGAVNRVKRGATLSNV